MTRRVRTALALALMIVSLALAAGACGINAEDRPHPIAPKETTTTLP